LAPGRATGLGRSSTHQHPPTQPGTVHGGGGPAPGRRGVPAAETGLLSENPVQKTGAQGGGGGGGVGVPRGWWNFFSSGGGAVSGAVPTRGGGGGVGGGGREKKKKLPAWGGDLGVVRSGPTHIHHRPPSTKHHNTHPHHTQPPNPPHPPSGGPTSPGVGTASGPYHPGQTKSSERGADGPVPRGTGRQAGRRLKDGATGWWWRRSPRGGRVRAGGNGCWCGDGHPGKGNHGGRPENHVGTAPGAGKEGNEFGAGPRYEARGRTHHLNRRTFLLFRSKNTPPT